MKSIKIGLLQFIKESVHYSVEALKHLEVKLLLIVYGVTGVLTLFQVFAGQRFNLQFFKLYKLIQKLSSFNPLIILCGLWIVVMIIGTLFDKVKGSEKITLFIQKSEIGILVFFTTFSFNFILARLFLSFSHRNIEQWYGQAGTFIVFWALIAALFVSALNSRSVHKLLEALHRIEVGFLVLCVSAMIILTFSQIILRNWFQAVDWFDPLVRYLVLFAGLLAAGIATKEGRHIKIDIVGRFTTGRFKEFVTAFTAAFAGCVSIALCIVSISYIIVIEMPSTEAAPFLHIPRWILLTIMPAGFCLMGARFFVRSSEYGIKAYKNIEISEESELDVFPVDEEKTFHNDEKNEKKEL